MTKSGQFNYGRHNCPTWHNVLRAWASEHTKTNTWKPCGSSCLGIEFQAGQALTSLKSGKWGVEAPTCLFNVMLKVKVKLTHTLRIQYWLLATTTSLDQLTRVYFLHFFISREWPISLRLTGWYVVHRWRVIIDWKKYGPGNVSGEWSHHRSRAPCWPTGQLWLWGGCDLAVERVVHWPQG